MNYAEFLASKALIDRPSGIKGVGTINPKLFLWQQKIVYWALRRGRAAIFADCGLGKTLMQLEWARCVAEFTNKPVLILAPIAVGQQTVREGQKFGIECHFCTSQENAEFLNPKIVVTNYEKLHLFDVSRYAGVVLDESSILKNYSGKIRNQIVQSFANTPFRLACTATPAPNDHMELGNHAEFLNVLTRTEMLCTFFIHDGGDTAKWRLKGHAENDFWRWMCSWACMVRKPSDLGFDDTGYELPELRIHNHVLDSERISEGFLFPMPAVTLQEQRKVKRDSIRQRCEMLAGIVGKYSKEPWLVSCELNDEGDELEVALDGAIQISGSDDLPVKEKRLLGFLNGTHRILVSKASIIGFGLNMQHCRKIAIPNLSHSYEKFYQLIRRCWRFGQTKPVDVHVFLMDTETPILDNMKRKQREADEMAVRMADCMRQVGLDSEGQTEKQSVAYLPKKKIKLPGFLKGA